MTKPDWCPADVWADTGMKFDQLYDAEPDLEGGCEYGIRSYAAALILAERERALEEAAGVADAYDAELTIHPMASLVEDEFAKDGQEFAAEKISAAIRALKETP